jgi:hypothetical protein
MIIGVLCRSMNPQKEKKTLISLNVEFDQIYLSTASNERTETCKFSGIDVNWGNIQVKHLESGKLLGVDL